jgi:hypothetical protein
VTVGWNTDEYVEILSGIPEGALVIISGNKAIPDSTIVITEEAAGRRRE